ncbi:Uncharacterized protein Rs2_28867 [Raphanus sativus]|nr:Uncharacterized protein Rs2_28867 [Raphanus sativus]
MSAWDKRGEKRSLPLEMVWSTIRVSRWALRMMKVVMSLKQQDAETSRNESKTDEVEGCAHSFILRDDRGYVCRVCGVIDKSILDIVEVNFSKAKKSTRSYAPESRTKKFGGPDFEIKLSAEGRMIGGLPAHPTHASEMKPHRVAHLGLWAVLHHKGIVSWLMLRILENLHDH